MSFFRELAERIAADLFTDGNGTVAERLVHRNDTEDKYGGGWSQKPMADRIEKTALSPYNHTPAVKLKVARG